MVYNVIEMNNGTWEIHDDGNLVATFQSRPSEGEMIQAIMDHIGITNQQMRDVIQALYVGIPEVREA